MWCTSWQLQEGQRLDGALTASAAVHLTLRALNALHYPCLQDPPAEEYDQMLAFYYKWQEKEKVCLLITALDLAVGHVLKSCTNQGTKHCASTSQAVPHDPS